MEQKQSLEHTTLLVLALLAGGDLYGYQMIGELERRSQNIFHTKEGTLYPVLKKLENGGLVNSYVTIFNNRTRKYYHLTQEGKNALAEEKKNWQAYADGINSVLSFSPG